MFGYSPLSASNYGVRLITGTFGAGKTKNVMSESIERKKKNPMGIVIANIPYEHVDIVYNTVDDMSLLLTYISKYINQTNEKEILKNSEFRPLLFIIDESHVYFFARNFKNNYSDDLIITLTQCRKRNIQMSIITQQLAQLDVMFRRLCPDVTMYKPFLLGITIAVQLYYKVSTATDVGDEYQVDVTGRYIILPNRLKKLLSKKYQLFLDQKYLTKYVIGYTKEFKYTYTDFFNILTSELHAVIVE